MCVNCAMTHSALVGMTSDPTTGVVAVVRCVHFVMEKEELSYIKEAVIRKLNLNMNIFYPDAGGILMGYQNVKIKKNTSKVTPTPVNIQAMFFLFRPQVGEDLSCVVIQREEGRVTCMAHRIFKVEAFSPPQVTVFLGQMVMVKVEAVEQMAWQEPRIVGTLLVESVSPFFEIVDQLESLTDSGIFEEKETSRNKRNQQKPEVDTKKQTVKAKKRAEVKRIGLRKVNKNVEYKKKPSRTRKPLYDPNIAGKNQITVSMACRYLELKDYPVPVNENNRQFFENLSNFEQYYLPLVASVNKGADAWKIQTLVKAKWFEVLKAKVGESRSIYFNKPRRNKVMVNIAVS
jgi:hypothetical protein